MIKILVDRPFLNEHDGNHYIEGTCLSTDTKPNLVATNSLMLELDTKKLWYCSQAGGNSEEEVYNGEIYVEESYYGTIDIDGFNLGDTITVTWGDKTYTCQKRIEHGDEDVPTWGAQMVETEEGGMDYDFSVYPFYMYPGRKNGFIIGFESSDNIPRSISISQTVTTPAVWTEYGTSSGGGLTDYVFKDITINHSDWKETE